MTEQLEQRIYELVRRYDGVYLFKQKTLTPQIDIDSDLNFERDEAAALMEEFSASSRSIARISLLKPTTRTNRRWRKSSTRSTSVKCR